MNEMYGINIDDSRVSKILPLIKEWQERPLQSVYAMVILDVIHYNVTLAFLNVLIPTGNTQANLHYKRH